MCLSAIVGLKNTRETFDLEVGGRVGELPQYVLCHLGQMMMDAHSLVLSLLIVVVVEVVELCCSYVVCSSSSISDEKIPCQSSLYLFINHLSYKVSAFVCAKQPQLRIPLELSNNLRDKTLTLTDV